ncbi:MAG TPA: hypothetical protein VGL57_10565 [Solirubrobacteraceae bacterium]
MDDVIAGPGGRAGSVRAGAMRRVVFATVAALLLLGVAPALASARVHWRLGGVPLTETIATKGKGTVKLTDTKVPIAGSMAVECEDSIEGDAIGATAGEVTKWTLSKCVKANAKCENTPTMEAVNLPWKAELVAAGSSVDEKLSSSGKGAPGFKMSCMIFGIKSEDTCTASLSQSTSNGTSGVSATFLAGEKLNCTYGETGAGVLEGSNTVEAVNGEKLSAELETPPSWEAGGAPLSSATAIKLKGKVKMSDYPLGEAEIECEAVGTGYAGPFELGEMTTWAMSGCSTVRGGCESPTIEAQGLPWHTELYSVAGSVENMIGTGGSKPGLKWKCLIGGVNFPDECKWMPPMTLTNTLAGVTAEFWKYGNCEYRSGGGKIEGSQTMELKSGGKLSVS